MADFIFKISAWYVYLTVKQLYAITLNNKLIFETAFAHLRYFFGGHRPSQTTSHKLFLI